MTNASFRSNAIATLKSLRDSGYTLECKLNASNKALHTELLRLEALLDAEETAIYDGLEAIYQAAKSAGLTAATTTPTADDLEAHAAPSGWSHKNHKLAQGPVCIYTAPNPPIANAAKATAKAVHITRYTDYQRLFEMFLMPFVACYVLGYQARQTKAGRKAAKTIHRQLRVRRVNDLNRILLLETLLCLN